MVLGNRHKVPVCSNGFLGSFGRGIPELGEHRLLFAFTLATGGRYYGDIPTTTKNSAVLKKAASEAKENLGPDAKLLPLIHWFRVKFGNSTVR